MPGSLEKATLVDLYCTRTCTPTRIDIDYITAMIVTPRLGKYILTTEFTSKINSPSGRMLLRATSLGTENKLLALQMDKGVIIYDFRMGA